MVRIHSAGSVHEAHFLLHHLDLAGIRAHVFNHFAAGAIGEIPPSEGLPTTTLRSVIATLWEAADVTTAELMVRFYTHLRSGKSKTEALQAAQLELIQGPVQVIESGELALRDASAPYYWAGFQLYGDWR